MVKIFCKNTGTSKEFSEGTSLLEISSFFDFPKPHDIISAKVNYVTQGLKYRVYNNRTVEFLDYTSYTGRSMYCRSLCFLTCKAIKDLWPDLKVSLRRPISKGYFCTLRDQEGRPVTPDVEAIRARMKEIVASGHEFRRHEVQVEEAIEMFRRLGYDDKVRLLETCGETYISYYTLDGTPDYFYDALVPSASYLKVWDLIPFHGGFILMIPDRHDPDKVNRYVSEPKTLETIYENIKWNRYMDLDCVGDVNKACQNGKASEIIQIAEALQERKIVQIADEIERRFHSGTPLRVVLIAGPSSAGKSTFCLRLSTQLKACGLRPVFFSTDDYFVNRLDTPRLPDGSFDFDNFETVDHRALERDVQRLLAGEIVDIPEYNFVTGLREYNGKSLKLAERSVLIIEGIHALNPGLIPSVPKESQFRIFISTVTSISLDEHNSIPTSDNRLLRRIIRDYKKGAFSAVETIRQWPNVRRAEAKWIYPYMESADVLFNSAYLVEFAVLRSHAEQILATVPKNCPEYSEAHRLLKFLHYFVPVSDKDIPATSLIRSFIGGGSLGA